jgi:hypothetical protein
MGLRLCVHSGSDLRSSGVIKCCPAVSSHADGGARAVLPCCLQGGSSDGSMLGVPSIVRGVAACSGTRVLCAVLTTRHLARRLREPYDMVPIIAKQCWLQLSYMCLVIGGLGTLGT